MNDRDEWRADVRRTSDRQLEINADSHRAALGMIGDREDDR